MGVVLVGGNETQDRGFHLIWILGVRACVRASHHRHKLELTWD